MYSLILEYNQEQGGNLSTAAEVSWILQKPNHKPQDIEKRDDLDPHVAIHMVDSKLQPLLCAITKLQMFLDRMAQLIKECSTVFCIDPHETMTLALQGWASQSQLEVAHKILLIGHPTDGHQVQDTIPSGWSPSLSGIHSSGALQGIQ